MEEQGRVDVVTWRLRSGVTVCRELTTEEGEGPDLVGARPCDWLVEILTFWREENQPV